MNPAFLAPLDPSAFQSIVFFTGAGMSAESGVPTYRGSRGIWQEYNWQDFACQEAFDRQPEQVVKFHDIRRNALTQCQPHRGHRILAEIEKSFGNTTIVTQNIDGLHQSAGSQAVIELHGSLWRQRCDHCGCHEVIRTPGAASQFCACGRWLRPDIIWFGDSLNESVVDYAVGIISECDLFISIGTSAVVWPAAGFPELARSGHAHCIEINPEVTDLSARYHVCCRQTAGTALPSLFPEIAEK